jgi:hypothetical protein
MTPITTAIEAGGTSAHQRLSSSGRSALGSGLGTAMIAAWAKLRKTIERANGVRTARGSEG